MGSKSTQNSSSKSEAGVDAGATLVAVGGGTGLASVLRGLKPHVGTEIAQLTAVVTMSDDGGSSGRLRRDFGVPPPGDIRNCIAALADDEDLLARLFQYRFVSGEGLSGHSFGNLFLTALTGITGDFYQAVLTAEAILSVRGQILPATMTDVRLAGEGSSGRRYEGESEVGASGERLRGIHLEPAWVPAFPPAVEAIRSADLILLGPGSLYTSILPNLLIHGIREAIAEGPARVVLPLNLMTQPGETDGMSARDHLAAIEQHAGTGLVDCVVFNESEIPEERLRPYVEAGSEPVAVDGETFAGSTVEVIGADLLASDDLVRHDPEKLARAILAL